MTCLLEAIQMSRIVKNSTFKLLYFQNKACYRAKNRLTDISLKYLWPVEGKNSNFLILVFLTSRGTQELLCFIALRSFPMEIADMAYRWMLAFVSLFMLCSCSFEAEKKGGYFHALSDEAYKTLLLLVQGKFKMPVAERTREQRNAVVHYWRQWDSLHLGPQSTPTLYLDGKKVVKKSSIASVLATTFDQA